jgi:RNA polymerase sigma factor (sigma-70 family)
MHAYAAPRDSESAVDLAFEHLYRRYVKDVYRYTLAVLRNPSDAEDVTQTTFLNAYRAFQRGEQPRKPQHWLIKIAHNACRTRYLRNARRPVEVPLDEGIAHVPVPEGGEMDVEELLAALGELPFRQRAALVLRELDGRSYREIAETLEVTVPAVETLIFRARRRLRADRAALRGLAAVPLPPSLASFVGGSGGAVAGGGALLGTGFAFKVVLLLAAGIAAGGVATNGFKAIAAPPHPTRATALGERVRQPASVGGARSTALLTKTGMASTAVARRSAQRGGATFARGRAANLPPGVVHLGTISTAPRGGAAPPPPAGAEPGAGPAVAAPPAEPSAQPSSPGSTPSAPTAPTALTAPTAPSAPTTPTTSAVSTVTTAASQATTSPVPDVSAPAVPPPSTILDPVTSLLPPPPPLPDLP